MGNTETAMVVVRHTAEMNKAIDVAVSEHKIMNAMKMKNFLAYKSCVSLGIHKQAS